MLKEAAVREEMLRKASFPLSNEPEMQLTQEYSVEEKLAKGNAK
jgi:hypothetical protein